MDRKKFLRRGIIGLSSAMVLPATLSSCSSSDTSNEEVIEGGASCALTPTETLGPFPNLTPAELVKSNIVSDRSGVAFVINLTVLDQSNNCQALEGAIVDIWHCDAEGNYSQYGNTFLQEADYTDRDFLRGRQATDANGSVAFLSIFPGWYGGRAPHIHLDIQDSEENSLLVTQLAFPKEVCDVVYATDGYNGEQDTLNETDQFFRDGFSGNLLDSLTGNITDGYVMEKTIIL